MKHLISEIRRAVSELTHEECAGRALADDVFARPDYCGANYQRPAYLRRQIVVRRRGENRWAMEQGIGH